MMKSMTGRIALALSVTVAGLPARAEAQAQRVIDASVDRSTGDKIRGPATITIKKINVLRYDVGIGVSVTFTAGPDISDLPFIPALGGEEKEGVASAAGEVERLKKSSPRFTDLLDLLNRVERPYAALRASVATNMRVLASTASELSALVRVSDAVLQATNGETTLVSRAGAINFGPALKVTWPVAPDVLESALMNLQLLEGQLSTVTPTPEETQVVAYVRARIHVLRSGLEALRDSGELATKFRDTQEDLRRWQPIVGAIVQGKESSFTRIINADCGFQFETTKESKYELVTRDRLVANAPEAKRELVTVVCTAPLSISGGFGFSFVDEQTFALVSSKPESGNTAVAKFGSSARSTYRPLPVILLNTRIKDIDDVWSVHASAGAVVDISTGETGTDVEFVLGPSVAMSRVFFLTAGWHWGRVSKLAGGFAEGDTVPEGVTAPPLEKSWSGSFAILATWKLR